MENKKLISVIVPIYKVEQYLDKCIQSIINQTYQNLQIILVDDGSPDNCGKIADQYAKMDQRIEVIHQTNKGLSEARNNGIKKAKGEYIGFVDSDDYIDENMYENMLKLIEKKTADVCICNFYEVSNGNIKIKNKDNGIVEYDKIQILKEVLLDKNIQSYAWNKLYKRKLFDGIQYPAGKKYEDIGTTFYVLEKCDKIIVTGEPEYYYVTRKDSIVSQVNEQTIMDYIEIIDKRYDYVEKNYPELQKYNRYYLAKTLITAYQDIQKIGQLKEKNKDRVNQLVEKVKRIIKEKETQNPIVQPFFLETPDDEHLELAIYGLKRVRHIDKSKDN